MRTRGRRLAVVLLAFAAGCSSGPPASTPVSVGPAPASFWTTVGAARKLFPGKPVPVTVAPSDGTPLQGTDAEGRYFEQLGEKGEPVQLATCRDEAVPSGERISFCTGMAPGAPALGRTRDGSVYRRLADGSVVKIGEARGVEALPSGERLLLTRAAGSSDPWIGSASAMIWSRGDDGKFAPAGEGRYLWATTADGARRHLYMSRGPKRADRWVGEQDGVLYVER